MADTKIEVRANGPLRISGPMVSPGFGAPIPQLDWSHNLDRPPRHAGPAGSVPSALGRNHEAGVCVACSLALPGLSAAYYPACQARSVCSTGPPKPRAAAAIGQWWPLARQ